MTTVPIQSSTEEITMSFLSLAKGDPAARNLLQRAIRARYGIRPLAIDSVRMTLSKLGKGPLGLPARTEIIVSALVPNHWQWSEARRIWKIALGTTIYS